MPKTCTVTAAAIYCRVSQDRAGEGLGVDRQEALCRKLAKEKGWPVADVYVDNDVSAFNGHARAEYRHLLADIQAGIRDAVICVDLDRLTRRPAELEEFMDLADRQKVALANVSGDTDLSTSDGRFKARIMGAVARQESERKGERVQREAEQAARRGVPRGSRRGFGYEADRVTIRGDEAELIRDAARRVRAGETVPSIARDWNARGIPTPQDAPHGWHSNTVMGILRNPRNAALRTYKGEVVGEGQWPPILDRATYEALHAQLRRTSAPGRPARRLLAGIARCGQCGGPLVSSYRSLAHGRRVLRYQCSKQAGRPGCGKLAIVAEPVDEIVRDAVIAALAGPALAKARRIRAGDDKVQEKAARDLADADARRKDIAADYAAGEITRGEWIAMRDKISERITTAHRILDRGESGTLAGLPGDEKPLRDAWEAGTIEWRRALITTVLDRVTITPATKPSPNFDAARVDLVWKV